MSINASTYLNATTAVGNLKEGIALTVQPSSVLGELLDASVSFTTMKTTDLPAILVNPKDRGFGTTMLRDDEERAQEVECITANTNESSIHSLRISAIAEDIAPLISSHLSYARNTVAPLVVDLENKLTKFVEYARPIDPVGLFEIQQGEIPAPLFDESFMADGLESYVGTDISYKSIPFSFDVPAETDLMGFVNVGSERLNGLVADWMKKKPSEWLKNVFLSNFTGAGVGINMGQYTMGQSNNVYNRLDVSLACYLIAKRLFAEPQSVPGIALAKYKNDLRDFIDYAGCEIVKSMAIIKRQLETGVIVAEAILSKKRVTVNKTNYNAWLQSGGKPEVILGMLAIGDIRYTVAAIEENREKFIRGWQSYVTLTQVDIKNEMRQRFRDFAVNEVLSGLDDMTDLEKEYHGSVAVAKEKVVQKLNEQIERMSHRIMDDIQHTALHLVAKGRFYFTSAYNILSEMAEAAKVNPEIDPREAALLSTISYMADYLDAQIQLEK